MRREVLVLVLVVVVAILAGVATSPFSEKDLPGDSSAGGNNSQAAVEVPFALITNGLQSKVSERVNYLIQSEAGLQELWKLIEAEGQPPEVDFTQEAVIAVFAGERPTAGHSVAVSKVEDMGDSRVVTISLIQPAPDCVTAQMVTMPYEILKLPATPLPLTHKDSVAVVNCSE